MKKVLERILALKAGASAAAFARTLGMRQQTVDNYVSGRRKMSVEFITSICCKYSVSADWLLGYTDDRVGHSAPVADSASASRIAELESEIRRLQAEIGGLRYALDAIGGRGAHGVSARHTARGLGA